MNEHSNVSSVASKQMLICRKCQRRAKKIKQKSWVTKYNEIIRLSQTDEDGTNVELKRVRVLRTFPMQKHKKEKCNYVLAYLKSIFKTRLFLCFFG